MFSTITHLKHRDNSSNITVLIVGAEGTGTTDISKCLLDIGTTVNMKVHTCSCLPPVEGSQLYNTSVDFICLILQLSSKESFETMSYSLSKLDVNYFLGRTVIIVNTKGAVSTEQAGDTVLSYNVKTLAEQYGVPVYYRNTQSEADRLEVSRKLVMLIQTAVGLKPSMSPHLCGTVSV